MPVATLPLPYEQADCYPWRIHGTGIFTYIYHKNQPNVGKYTQDGILWVILTNKNRWHHDDCQFLHESLSCFQDAPYNRSCRIHIPSIVLKQSRRGVAGGWLAGWVLFNEWLAPSFQSKQLQTNNINNLPLCLHSLLHFTDTDTTIYIVIVLLSILNG